MSLTVSPSSQRQAVCFGPGMPGLARSPGHDLPPSAAASGAAAEAAQASRANAGPGVGRDDPGCPCGFPFPRRGPPQGLGEAAHEGCSDLQAPSLAAMREHGLLAPSRVGSPHGPRNHDGTIIPETLDTMWGGAGQGCGREASGIVFVAIDHHSAECVRLHAARRGTRFEALEPPRQGVREHCGGFVKDVAAGLSLRHDHGSQYMSDAFQNKLKFLGIESSPAFVRAPEGNDCAERFIRTLKENLLWVRTFDTVEQLCLALLEFRQTYNLTWLIKRQGFRTPDAVRQNQFPTTALAA